MTMQEAKYNNGAVDTGPYFGVGPLSNGIFVHSSHRNLWISLKTDVQEPIRFIHDYKQNCSYPNVVSRLLTRPLDRADF
jgi:hypothetical protein